jgi:broad specificity phosphatase PhoE
MKLYILRHEDRTQDATMFSPLTKEGLKNSVNLVDTLQDLEIDLIYSSPFIRTLQTVHPFAKSRNKKINLEYGLQEIQHPSLIPENSHTVSLPIYICESFNYNPKYRSTLEPENNKYPEDEQMVTNRVKKVLSKIMNDHLTTKNNILIVTHQVVCNAILKIANKQLQVNKIEYTYKYPKGGLTKIWNVDTWELKKINWKD